MDETSIRWCVACGKTKPLTLEFFPSAGSKGGRQKVPEFRHRCRACSQPSPKTGKGRRMQPPVSQQRP